LKFHPWYGFGAVDATAAVNSAISHTSLSSHSFTSWNDSPEYNTYLWDYQLNTHSLEESGAGTIEHVKVRVSFSHRQPNSLGFRLESPSGTVITLLPPLTTWFTDPGLDTWVYLPANAFYGESKVGTWKLYTVDHYGQTGGYFAQWGIKFMYR
jgi:subtilisin-like proprotein convertase family protein